MLIFLFFKLEGARIAASKMSPMMETINMVNINTKLIVFYCTINTLCSGGVSYPVSGSGEGMKVHIQYMHIMRLQFLE